MKQIYSEVRSKGVQTDNEMMLAYIIWFLTLLEEKLKIGSIQLDSIQSVEPVKRHL